MFIEQKHNVIYRVHLALDRVLSPFWNLSKHLLRDSLLSGRDYSLFDRGFQEEIQTRLKRCDDEFLKTCSTIMTQEIDDEEKEKAIEIEEQAKYDTVYSEAFQIIVNFYLKKIVSPDFFDKRIKTGCSLIVFSEQGECWFFAEGDARDQFDKEVRTGLASMRIVDECLNFLNGGIDVPNSYNPKIYANVFPDAIDDVGVAIYSPLYERNAVSSKMGVSKEKSSYSVWYNRSCLRELGYADPIVGDVYEFKSGDTLVGLETEQFFIPMVTDWRSYFDIKDKALVVWTDHLNRVYSLKEQTGKKKTAKVRMTENERSFVEAASSEEFTNILSNLKDNLYLDDDTVEIGDEYKRFFHTLLKIEDLKHLVDYNLFVPKPEKDTVVGVYKIHKLSGETEYNLRHMLYMEQKGGMEIFRDYNEEAHNVLGVKVLKPQFASFYMMDYYEFLVEEVLKYLMTQGLIKGYLRNLHYIYRDEHNSQKECEIDALVYTGRKIAVMELKTTMHIESLMKYPKMFATFLKNELDEDLYEFFLVSSFADENFSVLDISERDGYNVIRKGLKTVPYKFDVNIPGWDRKMHCLAESSFTN